MAGNRTDLTISLKQKPKSTDSPNLMPNLKEHPCNNNNLFKMIKKPRRAGSGVPYLNSTDSGARTFTSQEKCNSLSKHFANMHKKKNPLEGTNMVHEIGVKSRVDQFRSFKIIPEFKPISSKEVATQIRRLKTNKSPGPDRKSAVAIKNYSHTAIEFLTKVYNSACVFDSFQQGGKWPNQYQSINRERTPTNVVRTDPLHYCQYCLTYSRN